MRKNLNPLVPLYHFLYAVSMSVTETIFLSWPLLLLFILVQKTNETVHLPVLRVMHNYNQLLFYLLWPGQRRLRMDDFHTSTSAAQHFADCKRLFLLALAVFIFCLLLQLLARHRKERRALALDRIWALIFLILPMAVLPFAVANFDSFFILFHHLFFRGDSWLFNPAADPIIDILTEGFFAACFAVAGIIYELYFAAKLLHR